jgi:chromate transporter
LTTIEQPLSGARVPVSRREAFWVWSRIACLSFGGPAGQIAVMHRILVEEKKWVSEERFLHALNFCMLLPGPEAQQLTVYIGWLMHGVLGGLLAGTLFVLPGFVSILLLSLLYVGGSGTALVAGLFFGLKPAVMAVVIEAVIRIGKKVLKNRVMFGLAVAAFIAIFFCGVPFPLIVLSAGLIGFVGGRVRPDLFAVLREHAAKAHAHVNTAPAGYLLDDVHPPALPSWSRSLRVCAVWLPLWLGPVAAVWWRFGWEHTFTRVGVFFSEAAMVTFGGAYAVLGYLAQAAVERYHWLQPPEMLDGLGMAETTPGPLIMVTQFVGFLATYRNPGELSPIIAGVLGSMLTTWVTFTPCFFWIFLGAPSVERLRGNIALTAALSAITAAVVGVVLNLAVWFSLHVLFGDVEERHRFGLRLLIPDLTTIQPLTCVLAVGACVATFHFKIGIGWTLAACAAIGIVAQAF